MENKFTHGDFTISVNGSKGSTITRDIKFKTGDTGSFTVTLPNDPKATIAELHIQSVEKVISLLQDWIAPQKPPSGKAAETLASKLR